MNWGERIRQERLAKDITKTELALMCNLTYATINNLEKGKMVTAKTLEKVCSALGLKIKLKK